MRLLGMGDKIRGLCKHFHYYNFICILQFLMLVYNTVEVDSIYIYLQQVWDHSLFMTGGLAKNRGVMIFSIARRGVKENV